MPSRGGQYKPIAREAHHDQSERSDFGFFFRPTLRRVLVLLLTIFLGLLVFSVIPHVPLDTIFPVDLACSSIFGGCSEFVLVQSFAASGAGPNGSTPEGWRNFKADEASASALQVDQPLTPTLSETLLPTACADLWVSKGKLSPDCALQISQAARSHDPASLRIDVLWTWVRGSDPILDASRRYAVANAKERSRWANNDNVTVPFTPNRLRGPARNIPRPGSALRHFRDHDELRFSMRAAVKSLGSERIRMLQLLTADVPLLNASELSALQASDFAEVDALFPTRRLGQTPSWLDPISADRSSHHPAVLVRHHSEAFKIGQAHLRGLAPGAAQLEGAAKTWRESVLPSFSSLSIESQIGHLQDIGKSVLYLNDDVFALRPMSIGDLSTPFFGPVFRVQTDLLVRPWPWGQDKSSKEGEWPSLTYTNWLLSLRFGDRPRYYLQHTGKILAVPTMWEAVDTWPTEFSMTASTRFRGRGREVTTTFLVTYYHIEKHREALLYSFVVLACDRNLDGVLDPPERRAMLMRLGRVFNKRADVSIDPATRETIDLSAFAKQVNDQNVFETPLATTYGWVSGDGYPLANVHFDTKERRPNQCLIDFEYCLGQDFGGSSSVDVDTVDLFKRIAFELPHCGDCVVTALVGKSGDRGLEAFLPVAKKGKRPPDVGEVPAVGRGANWRTADFAIPNAARVSPRAWAVRAIQRYSYAFGDSENRLAAIYNYGSAIRHLRPLENASHPALYVSVNDDIIQPAMVEPAEGVMKDFFEKRIGTEKGWWEL